MGKGCDDKACDSLRRLRHTQLQAVHDLYYIYVLLGAGEEIKVPGSGFMQLWTVGRNQSPRGGQQNSGSNPGRAPDMLLSINPTRRCMRYAMHRGEFGCRSILCHCWCIEAT